MRALLLLATTILSTGSQTAAHPQTHELSVQLCDFSPAGSPLKASGQVSFHEEISVDSVRTQYALDAKLTNVSLKPILALELSLDFSSDRGAGYNLVFREDAFFARDLFGPSSVIPLETEPSTWEITPYREGVPPRKEHAELRVLFVEFADGSKFGKSPWGDKLCDERTAGKERLSALLRAYESGKGAALSAAIDHDLARRGNPISVDTLLHEIKDLLVAQGPDAAVREIRSRVINAQQRKDVMCFDLYLQGLAPPRPSGASPHGADCPTP